MLYHNNYSAGFFKNIVRQQLYQQNTLTQFILLCSSGFLFLFKNCHYLLPPFPLQFPVAVVVVIQIPSSRPSLINFNKEMFNIKITFFSFHFCTHHGVRRCVWPHWMSRLLSIATFSLHVNVWWRHQLGRAERRLASPPQIWPRCHTWWCGHV